MKRNKRNEIPLFTFENVVFLSDRDVLRLVEEIDNMTLLQACKKCDILIMHRLISQFSNLGRDYFCDDFVRLGTVPDEEILAAQERIGKILTSLYQKDKLRIGHSSMQPRQLS